MEMRQILEDQKRRLEMKIRSLQDVSVNNNGHHQGQPPPVNGVIMDQTDPPSQPLSPATGQGATGPEQQATRGLVVVSGERRGDVPIKQNRNLAGASAREDVLALDSGQGAAAQAPAVVPTTGVYLLGRTLPLSPPVTAEGSTIEETGETIGVSLSAALAVQAGGAGIASAFTEVATEVAGTSGEQQQPRPPANGYWLGENPAVAAAVSACAEGTPPGDTGVNGTFLSKASCSMPAATVTPGVAVRDALQSGSARQRGTPNGRAEEGTAAACFTGSGEREVNAGGRLQEQVVNAGGGAATVRHYCSRLPPTTVAKENGVGGRQTQENGAGDGVEEEVEVVVQGPEHDTRTSPAVQDASDAPARRGEVEAPDTRRSDPSSDSTGPRGCNGGVGVRGGTAMEAEGAHPVDAVVDVEVDGRGLPSAAPSAGASIVRVAEGGVPRIRHSCSASERRPEPMEEEPERGKERESAEGGVDCVQVCVEGDSCGVAELAVEAVIGAPVAAANGTGNGIATAAATAAPDSSVESGERTGGETTSNGDGEYARAMPVGDDQKRRSMAAQAMLSFR